MNIGKKTLAMVLCSAVCVSAAAYANNALKTDRAYAFQLENTKIVVGKTTLDSLYSAGFDVEIATGDPTGEENTVETVPLSSDMLLAENSRYTDFYITKDDEKQLVVDVMTSSNATLSKATIADIRLDTRIESNENVSFGGVAVSELTPERFLKLVKESSEDTTSHTAVYSGEKYTVEAAWDDAGSLETLRMARNNS